jgi:hypothetical protein
MQLGPIAPPTISLAMGPRQVGLLNQRCGRGKQQDYDGGDESNELTVCAFLLLAIKGFDAQDGRQMPRDLDPALTLINTGKY